MHELIASPFLDEYLVVRPGHDGGVQIPLARYLELSKAASLGHDVPTWLADASRQAWGLGFDTSRPLADTVLIRPLSPYGMSRASWELNLGCDFECDHCYLGAKKFQGLSWPDKERLLNIIRDAGVLVLQMTGGEPLIDPHFPAAYTYAY